DKKFTTAAKIIPVNSHNIIHRPPVSNGDNFASCRVLSNKKKSPVRQKKPIRDKETPANKLKRKKPKPLILLAAETTAAEKITCSAETCSLCFRLRGKT